MEEKIEAIIKTTSAFDLVSERELKKIKRVIEEMITTSAAPIAIQMDNGNVVSRQEILNAASLFVTKDK